MNAPPSHRARPLAQAALGLVALAAVLAAGWMALTVGNPVPSKVVVMATGPAGSGYAEFGMRYQEILRRAGVDLRLVTTAGGVENLERLRDARSGVSVAFVESGLADQHESPDLRSLGTVAVEPLWIFVRARTQGPLAQRLAGKRISIEPEGSATRVLARRLLALNGVSESSVSLVGLPPEEAADALVRGAIDAVFMVTSWQSSALQRLLKSDGITLEGHPRADAYVAQYPALSKVILPTGAADLARNIPSTDVPLLAVETSLLVRDDLHPAVQYLLLEAASEIHGRAGLFSRAGRFPAAEAMDVPLSAQARTYYRSGRPFVYRYFPYWLAGLVERLLIVLVPLLVVIYPVASVLPRLYVYLAERRVYLLYRELWVAERMLDAPTPVADMDVLAATLEDLDRRAMHLRVPLAYAQRLFILKSHIAAVRAEVRSRQASHAPPSPATGSP